MTIRRASLPGTDPTARGRRRWVRARRTFRAMGTNWQIEAADCSPSVLREAEALVREVEARCSRFLPDSALSRLNRDRHIQDAMLAEITSLALEFRALTRGAFDPAVGDEVLAAGYDRSIELLPERGPATVRAALGRPGLPVRSDVIEVRGAGYLDLGGIAKGWTVDRVGAFLEEHGAAEHYVDGGGDVLVGGVRERGKRCVGVGEQRRCEHVRRHRVSRQHRHLHPLTRRGQPAPGIDDVVGCAV